MMIVDFFGKESVILDLKARTKRGVIKELVGILVKTGKVKNGGKVLKAILEREKVSSTGIGEGIAIPHAKIDETFSLVGAFGRSEKGIDFKALDGEPVHLFFLIVVPEKESNPYINVLAKVSRLLRHKQFCRALRTAKSAERIIKIIKDEEAKEI